MHRKALSTSGSHIFRCMNDMQFIPHLKRIIRTRDELKTESIKKKSDILLTAYKNKANNTVKIRIRECCTDKIKATKGNIKETWTTSNTLVNQRSKTTIINSLSDGIQLILNPLDITNKMNNFCTVGEQLIKEKVVNTHPEN